MISSNNSLIKKKKTNRCFFKGCKKKLKLTDIMCHCKHTYCSLHRLPHQHNCCYLVIKKKEHRDKIMENKHIKDKVDKI